MIIFYGYFLNLYLKVKSYVKLGARFWDYFTNNVGVSRGENISPLLFALYVNDLQQYSSNGYNGLVNDICIHLSDQNVEVYVRLFAALRRWHNYTCNCKMLWSNMNDTVRIQLKIYTQKTKIVVFGRGNINSRLYWDVLWWVIWIGFEVFGCRPIAFGRICLGINNWITVVIWYWMRLFRYKCGTLDDAGMPTCF